MEISKVEIFPELYRKYTGNAVNASEECVGHETGRIFLIPAAGEGGDGACLCRERNDLFVGPSSNLAARLSDSRRLTEFWTKKGGASPPILPVQTKSFCPGVSRSPTSACSCLCYSSSARHRHRHRLRLRHRHLPLLLLLRPPLLPTIHRSACSARR